MTKFMFLEPKPTQHIDRLNLANQIVERILALKKKQVVGFLSLRQHTEFAAEIYVMAVHPQFHRQGIGHQLIEVAEKNLRKHGIEYLQVKTLGVSRSNSYYAQTRAFYQSVGFKPLEEFLEIWQGNPCLQMVKSL